MANKERIDCALVSRGLIESREKAKAVIMSGIVYVNNQKCDKAGMTVSPDAIIEIRGEKLQYVSRGGLKLEKAIKSFGIALDGLICADIGASTGGFTDCMLQNGAKKVYSIDVGHGQLAWSLRNDERVVCMEKTNFRYCTPEDIGEAPDFASVDVSFISLTKILEPAVNIIRDHAQMVCLIKPQFEAGPSRVRKGVVRDPEVQRQVLEELLAFLPALGLMPCGLTWSPVRGSDGNIEFLCCLRRGSGGALPEVRRLVEEARCSLK